MVFSETVKMEQKIKEVGFSIELESKEYLKTIRMADSKNEPVLVEGTIGQLQQTGFDDCIMLEVIGDKGVLRLDLSQDEIHFTGKKEVQE